MADRDLPHLFVRTPVDGVPFTLPSSGGSGSGRVFPYAKRTHGSKLINEYSSAVLPDSEDIAERGTYVSFESFPDLELALESLEIRRVGDQPELVAVQQVQTPTGLVQVATVFVPAGKKGYFLDKLRRYVASVGAPTTVNANLVEGIAAIHRATIRDLWTDPLDEFPEAPNEVRWWEVWLRRGDQETRGRFTSWAQGENLKTSGHYLGFGDRTVVLVEATVDQLSQAMSTLDDIAELRRPHELSSFLPSLSAVEQGEWVDELVERTYPADDDSPVVCVLDTGVQQGHPLLASSLDPSDVHAIDPNWPVHPVHPHGTEMAGLALFEDLQGAVLSSGPVNLSHRLESVKILPDNAAHDPSLFGAVTARAVDRPEIQSVGRRRVFMLAVTARDGSSGRDDATTSREAGRPTSWSAAVDALAFGRAINDTDSKFTYLDRDEERRPRLFVVSAGNIRDLAPSDDHLDRSDLEPVEDPAQAWNALVVGAFSETDDMAGAPAVFDGYTPIAPRGELAPTSRTSVIFDRSTWPVKPDVVADGGNVAASPDGKSIDTPENLALLTTRLQTPGVGFFTTSRDTSAATAQVSAIAASISAAYPSLQPETVRALVVHSAEWTPAMRTRFEGASNKAEAISLLRRYGMGVPSRDRAIRSASDALTLVVEGQIRPYERSGSAAAGRTREMKLHELPWPTQVLEDLGAEQVRLRVTLSYFVEPNPSSRGWSGRYVYPSHGLRFAMRRPEESLESFGKRINKKARDGEQGPPSLKTEKGWLFGANQQQAPGSLHTDIWQGNAVDLASKGAIAIYPVAGWWKNRPSWDQSDEGVDYSLVVSIESPDVEVDLWTPVSQLLEAAVVTI